MKGICLVDGLGVDLVEAAKRKLRANAAKYPVEKVWGGVRRAQCRDSRASLQTQPETSPGCLLDGNVAAISSPWKSPALRCDPGFAPMPFFHVRTRWIAF